MEFVFENHSLLSKSGFDLKIRDWLFSKTGVCFTGPILIAVFITEMVILFKHVIIIIIIIINIIKKPEFHLNFVLGCAISSVTLGLQKGT